MLLANGHLDARFARLELLTQLGTADAEPLGIPRDRQVRRDVGPTRLARAGLYRIKRTHRLGNYA